MSIGKLLRASDIQASVTSIAEKPWWLKVLLLVLASFLLIQVSGAISMVTLVPARGLTEGATFVTQIRGMDGIQVRFVRWDSGYYLSIVRRGYTKDGPERAFYPLYPLLVAGLTRLLGIQDLWSGLIISTLCYAAACLMLYRLITIDYSPQVALWTVIWLCVFPVSFFMIAFYAEPLLMLTFVSALYFSRRGNFIASGVCIALAGATRSMAILLAVPYIVEFFYQRKFDRRSWLKFITGALIAPLGVVAYYVYLAILSRSNNLLAIQGSFTKYWPDFFLTWPWITWIDGIRAALFGTNIPPIWFSRVLVIQDLAYALLGLAITTWAIFHLRPALSALLIAGMLLFSINHGPLGYAFWSIPRHLASLAPVYLVLALITLKIPPRLRWLVISASAVLLGFFSLWFARGGWVS